MKIYVLNKILEYENNEKVIDDMFSEIDSIISNSNYTFSHLNVDGYAVYEEFHNYFLDNIRNIKEVNVITKSFKEFVDDVLETTNDYLENAISEIEKLSNEFYKSPTKESWKKLVDLIEGIRWIMDTFTLIDKSTELKNIIRNYEIWNLYAKDIYSLRKLLDEFEDILQNKDLISTADILSYEVVPIFNDMKEKLAELIERKAGTSDFN